MDWLLCGDEATAVMADYWKTIDTILMGRKTYEAALRMDPRGGTYQGMHTYVFSRILPPATPGGTLIVSTDAVEFVRKLKQQDGKDICLMGGGELAHCLFEADLIDEIGFNIHPVLLGLGIPLYLAMSRQIDLQLQECRAFKNGCVLVRYAIKHGRTGR